MGKLVAVAEDNDTLRDLLEYQLSQRGYEVMAAADGEELWEKLAWFGPDLLILDVMMPKVDGLRVLRRIRDGEAEQIDPDVPVIIVTSLGREDDVVEGFDSGATDYVTKPFKPRELAARVERLLD